MSLEIKNKKAYFDYLIERTFEVGIVLTGNEVKSIKASQCNLKGAWCDISNSEMYIKSMHISKYQDSVDYLDAYDPYMDRKLLLHKKEILDLSKEKQLNGITIVPLKLYVNGCGMIKLLIGVCKGKKQYDKREYLKIKDIERSFNRKL